MKKIAIAIDGPAASGKSTTARLVAQRLGYLHIDTGAMYRAITFKVLEREIPLTDERAIAAMAETSEIRLSAADGRVVVLINGEDVSGRIRSQKVTKAVSAVSSIPDVRTVMVREQRRIAAGGGVVLEGRDIGTVVLPEADLKIFMVANVAERARRRKQDLALAGHEIDEVDLINEIAERDRRDSTRAASPLKKADDAIELDTSNLTIDQQVDVIVAEARRKLGQT